MASFDHLISDANGLYEESEAGRELIARIQHLKERIGRLAGRQSSNHESGSA